MTHDDGAIAGAGDGATRYKPKHALRFVTATSLFDGHDASINVIRRVLQAAGAEVIHLGHNRSAEEIAAAAVEEDVQALAVSSYQGGHIEFFKYLVDLLRERGAGHVRIFGGGGGVIVPAEIRELEAYGVARLYDAASGQELGLTGMIDDMLERADFDVTRAGAFSLDQLVAGQPRHLARAITLCESGNPDPETSDAIDKAAAARRVPVLGITGTGGAGKSSLTDELVQRLRLDAPELRIAILAVDPTRLKSGGALLGDRIRMNALGSQTFMRSLATRGAGGEVSMALTGAVAACKAAGCDMIIVETSGIGQGDAAIVRFVDVSLYAMTPEFGAASQLEKINMLDLADFVAVNKFDRPGAEDALRDVRKQVRRNREAFEAAAEDMPVYGTNAAHFNDAGVTALYRGIMERLRQGGWLGGAPEGPTGDKSSSGAEAVVPSDHAGYLGEIAAGLRGYHAHVGAQERIARGAPASWRSRPHVGRGGYGRWRCGRKAARRARRGARYAKPQVARRLAGCARPLPGGRGGCAGSGWPHAHAADLRDTIRNAPAPGRGAAFRRRRRDIGVADEGERTGRLSVHRRRLPVQRTDEDPTRMFAGEGSPSRTNARFKLLSQGSKSKRLSTAFDSVTLYGCDPDERPDIYGKVGNAGVSVATLADMRDLYDGFDLCNPMTSVSMTINGPAPTILAMYFNAAIGQQMARFEGERGRAPNAAEAAELRAWTHRNVRGTVQADILKEDQGQNTCLFSTEFSLKAMGDIQEYFTEHGVSNFYSVSVSGYHIAEAGANPITQLAFTLANGFTYVEAWLARGLEVDDFAPNLSFFFSAGMDPEYSVLGRVARRIWAVTMRERYGASERSQKLKYHIQTSGRSLHAQEMSFNDIRTTLQGLVATYDNANSLHTNAYDEAVTTPTDESVRRAIAIQMIINREWGLAKNENPNQGSFIIDELTDLVEEAVLSGI